MFGRRHDRVWQERRDRMTDRPERAFLVREVEVSKIYATVFVIARGMAVALAAVHALL